MTTAPSPYLRRREGACEIYLIRHGDATPAADGVIAESYDAQCLNPLGMRQADALAQYLKDRKFAAIYSSPLLRCLNTVQPFADALGMTFAVVEDLREVKHSADAQRSAAMSAAEYVSAFQAGGVRIGDWAMEHGTFDGLPGVEPRAEFRRRVREAVDGLAARHAGERIAVFTHGGTINVYLAVVLGLERDYFCPVPNTAYSVVRVSGERRVLYALNSTCHLRGLKKE